MQTLPKTFRQLCDYVYETKYRKGKNFATVKGHIEQIKKAFCAHLQPNTIKAWHIEVFKQKLFAEGNSAATVNRKLATLSSIMDMAKRLDMVTDRPDMDFEKEGPGRDRFLSEDEAGEFQQQAILYSMETGTDIRDWYDVFTFLLWTGCRFGELKLAKIHGTREKMTATFRETKNGQTRTIPLPYTARCTIVAFKAPTIEYYDFYTLWKTIKKRTSMKDDPTVTPHVLRHTCASWLVQRGVPLYTVSKWLGHTSIKTTERYAHLAPDQFAKAAELLG